MTLPRRVGALVVVVALLGACGGGDDTSKKASKKRSAGSDTTLSLDSDADSDATTTAAAGAAGATTTGKPGAPMTTAKGAVPVTTAKPVSAPPTAGGEAAPAPAKNGTYTYSQSGTTPDGPVPPQGTLVVNGTSFARFYDQSKQPQRLTYVFRSNGAFITGASLSFKGASANCSFGDGVAAPPWPPVVGSQSSKTGSCSGLVTLTAVVTSRVTSRNGDIVGITTNVHAYNADRSVDVTANDVEGWSISLRVPKTSRQTFSGSAFGSPVNGDVSSTLTGTP